jgi:hypothetical protein
MTRNYTGESFSESKFVPGTGRRIMSVKDGVQMERAYIYLPHDTWEALRSIGVCQGVSDSIIVERLVRLASSPQKGNV